MGRMYGGFLASEVALRLIRLGRYDHAERLISEALVLEPTGITGVTLGQTRAQLLVERGDLDGAGAELERVREMTERTDDVQWVAPLAAAEMELALWRGDAEAAGAIGERILARFDDAVFLASIAPVHAHALRAEADRWEWARARSEQPAHPERSERLRAGLDRLLALDPGPELRAWAALARAEAERAGDRREESAVAFGQTAELFAALAMPFRTAYARLREVEAALGAGSRAREVTDRLGEAHRLATAIGAPLLLAEIEGLARRGRVPLAAADEAQEQDAAARRAPRADRARARGAGPGGRGADQPPDRRAPLHERQDRQRARVADPEQAVGTQPRRGGGRGTPARAHRALGGHGLVNRRAISAGLRSRLSRRMSA